MSPVTPMSLLYSTRVRSKSSKRTSCKRARLVSNTTSRIVDISTEIMSNQDISRPSNHSATIHKQEDYRGEVDQNLTPEVAPFSQWTSHWNDLNECLFQRGQLSFDFMLLLWGYVDFSSYSPSCPPKNALGKQCDTIPNIASRWSALVFITT